MGIKRVVDVSFWDDDIVLESFSPEDKLFFLYLMTNPHSKQLGIYHINRKSMSFELGYSPEAVDVLLSRFEDDYKVIRYSRKTNELAIKNYLRHSIVKGGKPVEDLLVKEIAEVKDRSLLAWIHDSICNATNLNDTVKKVLPLLNDNVPENVFDNVSENVLDNVSENDNEVSSRRPVITNRLNDTMDESSEEEMPF